MAGREDRTEKKLRRERAADDVRRAETNVSGDVGSAESALSTKIPAGTYVLIDGPSGSLSEPLVAQRHVTRLTVTARNAFESDVLVETAQTQVNPLFPWLTSRSIEKKTLPLGSR